MDVAYHTSHRQALFRRNTWRVQLLAHENVRVGSAFLASAVKIRPVTGPHAFAGAARLHEIYISRGRGGRLTALVLQTLLPRGLKMSGASGGRGLGRL